MQALASRSQQLSELIANTSTATGAIANQSQALTQALTLFPSTLRRSTTTLAGLERHARRPRPAGGGLQAGRPAPAGVRLAAQRAARRLDPDDRGPQRP